MDSATHDRLLKATTRLKNHLARFSTSSIVGSCIGYHLRRARDPGYGGDLSSPARQLAFLLGLTLSTPPPPKPRRFTDGEWEKCIDLLRQVFGAYEVVLWPQPGQTPNLPDEWQRTREVAGQALIHYHNTDLMATVEQVCDRTKAYVCPFDELLEASWGLGGGVALDICDFILKRWERHQEAVADAAQSEKEARLALIEWEANQLTFEEVRQHATIGGYKERFDRLMDLLNQIGIVTKDELTEQFGEAGEAFWLTFTVERGSIELTYLTEGNPVDTRPLILLDSDRAMCYSINALFYAVLKSGERLLEQSNQQEKYRRARDKKLEDQVEITVRRLLGDKPQYYRGVFETADGHMEHDLILVDGEHVVVFEAKASPPKEPFRDPTKGFIRLQHAFSGDRGIQKAYEQADRIRHRLSAGETVDLFASSGTLLTRLDPQVHRSVHLVAVTRDDWGPLAVDLSLLLERSKPGAPYPWAVDILNLQAVTDAWSCLGMDASDFYRFLSERRLLHGRTICWDELDMVGFWLKHGGFHWLTDQQADRIHINPHYSDLFDDIYAATRLEGPPVVLEVTEPAMGDVRELMAEILGQLTKAGRNDPCPCGSGKKYKKCHGRNPA